MLKIVRPAEVRSNPVAECSPRLVELPHELPDVPVLPETLLGLDLEAQERCADLRAIAQLVLSDLGATLQILRLAGREFDDAEDRPSRIEDCISALGLQGCLEAVSARTVVRDHRYTCIAETWAHSREVALQARLVAEETPEVNPEEAYLVGLLHGIGLLPAVLGWDSRKSAALDCMSAGFKMAEIWLLPPFVGEFFRDMHRGECATLWPEIVRKAHPQAMRPTVCCPLQRFSAQRFAQRSAAMRIALK